MHICIICASASEEAYKKKTCEEVNLIKHIIKQG